jgi:hypothetical protein
MKPSCWCCFVRRRAFVPSAIPMTKTQPYARAGKVILAGRCAWLAWIVASGSAQAPITPGAEDE